MAPAPAPESALCLLRRKTRLVLSSPTGRSPWSSSWRSWGVPLGLTFRRNHVRPDYRDAHSHYQASESGPDTREYVPADRSARWMG